MYTPLSHPLGRHTITGTIIAIEIDDKNYRQTTLLHTDGWTITGSLPHRVPPVDIGDTITLTATLTDGHGRDVQHGRFRWASDVTVS